jgi:hypothetical protein
MKRLILLLAMAASTVLAAAGPLAADSAEASSTLPTLSLTINASSITVGGTLQSGGVNVVSTATGVKEASAILFLLKPGVSVAEVYEFLNNKKTSGDPNGASKYGSIVFDTEAAPGHSSEVQTNLQPGQYIALGGGGENVTKLRASFTVAAAPAPATLPTPQATVSSIEFGFRGPSTLHDGEVVRFENEGFLVHMDLAMPVKSEKVAKQLIKLLLAGNEKQAEKLIAGAPVGFAGPLSSGAYQQETITAKPGVYVEACFMDTQDGRSHTRLGMERIIHIVK